MSKRPTRDNAIFIRLTLEEHEFLKQYADSVGLPLAAFVRFAVLTEANKILKEDPK